MVTGSYSKVVIVASGLTGSTIWELATTISTVTSVAIGKTMRPCGVCQTSRANYLCMEVELEKAVSSNAMSNLQSEKRSLAHTKLDCIHKTGGYLQFCSFTFFALHNLFMGPRVAGKVPKS